MATETETEPAWVKAVKEKLQQPYTEEERERIRFWMETVKRINAGKRWPKGTLQALLDEAHQEDIERYERGRG